MSDEHLVAPAAAAPASHISTFIGVAATLSVVAIFLSRRAALVARAREWADAAARALRRRRAGTEQTAAEAEKAALAGDAERGEGASAGASSGGGGGGAAAAAAAAAARRPSTAPAAAAGPALTWPAPADYAPLLSAADARFVASALPSRLAGRALSLAFSTQRDGYSLATLYARARGVGPTLLVVLDDSSAVFGGFAATDWAGEDHGGGHAGGGSFARGTVGYLPSPVRGRTSDTWFGGADNFLFALSPAPALHRWARANSHFQLARDDCVAFGGSGAGVGGGGSAAAAVAARGGCGFGLWLDAGLEKGQTTACDTYGSAPLTRAADAAGFFRVVRVELWAFADAPAGAAAAGARRGSEALAAGAKVVASGARSIVSKIIGGKVPKAVPQ
jgi:hypothetical protein